MAGPKERIKYGLSVRVTQLREICFLLATVPDSGQFSYTPDTKLSKTFRCFCSGLNSASHSHILCWSPNSQFGVKICTQVNKDSWKPDECSESVHVLSLRNTQRSSLPSQQVGTIYQRGGKMDEREAGVTSGGMLALEVQLELECCRFKTLLSITL